MAINNSILTFLEVKKLSDYLFFLFGSFIIQKITNNYNDTQWNYKHYNSHSWVKKSNYPYPNNHTNNSSEFFPGFSYYVLFQVNPCIRNHLFCFNIFGELYCSIYFVFERRRRLKNITKYIAAKTK